MRLELPAEFRGLLQFVLQIGMSFPKSEHGQVK